MKNADKLFLEAQTTANWERAAMLEAKMRDIEKASIALEQHRSLVKRRCQSATITVQKLIQASDLFRAFLLNIFAANLSPAFHGHSPWPLPDGELDLTTIEKDEWRFRWLVQGSFLARSRTEGSYGSVVLCVPATWLKPIEAVAFSFATIMVRKESLDPIGGESTEVFETDDACLRLLEDLSDEKLAMLRIIQHLGE